MNRNKLENELEYNYVRSSGAGGQHVNKVSSKVELRFNVSVSEGLTENEKARVLNALKNRISSDATLILTSQASRSQFKNKALVTERFFKLLSSALARKKKRVATKPTKGSIKKRLQQKQQKSEKKRLRQNPDF